MEKISATLLGGALVLTILNSALANNTPCNLKNDTACLEGVQREFVRGDYWFGDDYYRRCPSGTDSKEFACMNPDLNHTTIGSRLLGHHQPNASTITQFLHIRFNSPRGVYRACGHVFDISPYVMTTDLDSTHTIYLDSWVLGHRPTVTFNPVEGEAYTLVAYDAGYVRLGGIWVNIRSGDSSTGQEVYPYKGPVNPLYSRRNPFVFALFRQVSGDITDIDAQTRAIAKEVSESEGHYHLDTFINKNGLEGPVGVGYVAINTDAYSIQHFLDRNIYNNCPYLVARQPDLVKALQVMGYQLTPNNSFSDYRSKFLTSLRVDVTVTYISAEAHFDSCCQHVMMVSEEVTLDPQDPTPLMPLYTRSQPYVKLTPVEMGARAFDNGQLYTLFLVDATDAVQNKTSHNVVIHWQVVNIPGDAVERGDTVLEYMSPLPQTRTEVRTFLFLLLSQPSRVEPRALWSYTGAACDSQTLMRCNFDLGSLLRHLNFQLVGLSLFRSQQDSFTRAVQYGSVDPKRMATSMSQFMSMPKPDVEPSMSKAQVCQGIPGYAEPCPAGCSSSMEHNHGDPANPQQPTTSTMDTEHMYMGHHHGDPANPQQPTISTMDMEHMGHNHGK